MTRSSRLGILTLLALLGSACASDADPPAGDGAGATADGAGATADGAGATADGAGATADGAAGDGASPPGSDGAGEPAGDAGIPRCRFTTPADGEAIADSQTYVEIATEHVASGSVAAMLVDFVPRASAQVIAGKAEFPTIALPPPSAKPVELRAEVKINYAQKISCAIHVTVKAP